MTTYVPSTPSQQQEMLDCIGYKDIMDLYSAVPESLFADKLDLPQGTSELELSQTMQEIASQNTVYNSIFRGAGAYNRYIPSIVKTVMGKEEFVTAYTPYQAEISQGVLQSIFEYQSMVCDLTGLDASNASMYDGASATAEAAIMCQERKRSRVVISETVHPETIATVKTYCSARGIEVSVIPALQGSTDAAAMNEALGEDGACGIFQQPNYYGILEDSREIINAVHENGARAVMIAEPISLGVLESPGELGADICAMEGQPLGLPLSFGGPYIGILTCTQALVRKLPGRIVGQTTDAKGNRCFVLTLQAREQHIRREKASSNICSNQALCALGVGVYLASMGPAGLEKAANLGYSKAQYAQEEICKIDGFDLVFNKPFMNEFLTTAPQNFDEIEANCLAAGILPGVKIAEGVLWCTTEMNSKAQIDALVEILKG